MSYYNDDGYRIKQGHHFDDSKKDFIAHFEIHFRNEEMPVSRYKDGDESKYIKTREKAEEIAEKAIEERPEWVKQEVEAE